jgi:hypothetical protein
VWLKTQGTPDRARRGLAQATARGHRAGAPVGRIGWRRLEGQRHDALHMLVMDSPWRARARLIEPPIESGNEKSTPPLAHRLFRPPQLPGHARVRLARGAGEDHSGALSERLGRCRPPCPRSNASRSASARINGGIGRPDERSPFYRENARCVHLVPSFADARD